MLKWLEEGRRAGWGEGGIEENREERGNKAGSGGEGRNILRVHTFP